jgi:hypothetical protein
MDNMEAVTVLEVEVVALTISGTEVMIAVIHRVDRHRLEEAPLSAVLPLPVG